MPAIVADVFDLDDPVDRAAFADQLEEAGRDKEAAFLRSHGSAAAFFYREAGYCVGRRAEGALSLAMAEHEASEAGLWFRWIDDGMGEAQDDSGLWQEYPAEACICMGEHGDSEEPFDCPLASLSGILEPGPDYRRVVQAGLAQEALALLARGRA